VVHTNETFIRWAMNHGMGAVDEYVEVEELLHALKAHLLPAYEYLAR
jgi:hypothetical protein